MWPIAVFWSKPKGRKPFCSMLRSMEELQFTHTQTHSPLIVSCRMVHLVCNHADRWMPSWCFVCDGVPSYWLSYVVWRRARMAPVPYWSMLRHNSLRRMLALWSVWMEHSLKANFRSLISSYTQRHKTGVKDFYSHFAVAHLHSRTVADNKPVRIDRMAMLADAIRLWCCCCSAIPDVRCASQSCMVMIPNILPQPKSVIHLNKRG